MLNAVRELLVADATVVVSLPNVRFYDTFFQLAVRDVGPFATGESMTGLICDGSPTQMRVPCSPVRGSTWFGRSRSYRLHDSPSARMNRFAPRVARGPLGPSSLISSIRIDSGVTRDDGSSSVGLLVVAKFFADDHEQAAYIGRSVS